MTKQLICAFLLAISLQGCFAWRMEIEDPLGAPETETDLSLVVNSKAQSPQHQANAALKKQLEQDLKRLLPRERHVRVTAACGGEVNCGKNYGLVLNLTQAQQELRSPLQIFGPPASAPQIRMELRLQGQLLSPEGKALENIDLVQRGSALSHAKAELETQLLERLRGRLLQQLQPKYRYYWE